MARWNSVSKNYTLASSFPVNDMNKQMQNFMLKGNISTDEEGEEYMPMMDGRSPLNFFPPHCVAMPKFDVFGSPVIAYIKSRSPVQRDMVKQLESFYENQQGIWNMIKTNDVLMQYVEDAIVKARNAKKTKKQLEKIEKDRQDRKEKNSNMMHRTQGYERSSDDVMFPNIIFRLQEFASKAELDEELRHPEHGKSDAHAGICYGFTVHERSRNDVEVELFFNDLFVKEYQSLPSQDSLAVSGYQMMPKVKEYAFYQYYGFAYLQNWAANTVLRRITRDRTAQITAMTVPMKIPPNMLKDPFAFLLTQAAPYIFMCMYIPMLYRTTYRIVQEKESRVRQTMRMMGMRDAPYWWSWFLYHTAISFTISVGAMVVAGYGIFSESSVGVVWLIFFLYGQAIFGLILTIQALFRKARIAAVMCIVLYLGCSALTAGGEKSTYYGNAVLSLFPTTCMSSTVKVILGLEQNGLKVTWYNLSSEYKNYSVALGLIMMCIDIVGWTVLGLYLEVVVPKEFGQKKGCCFCLTRGKGSIRASGDSSCEEGDQPLKNYDSLVEQTKAFETQYMRRDAYESVIPEVAALEETGHCMKISHLKKQYENGFLAVKGINLKLYLDQIFVLLGHNGAGKTSMISLLTGLYEPTSGEAEIFGVDMFEGIEQVRDLLGVCPQHDVLFELLTPQEHMEIFYDFKCSERDEQRKTDEINKLLVDLGVEDKRHDLAGQLSGGNQRKLSVAIALCGGSKFVVLDEPTAGMDLSARRQTWTMLKEFKKDRIILLTTHYMDEADILGDRIGIMSAGQLVTLGSSMFLKKKYGVGYNVTMLKNTKKDNLLVLPYFQDKFGRDVKKISEIQSEITVQIPKEYSGQFKEFFENFDNDLKTLKILGYGVSVTTLEDVFMKVGHMDMSKSGKGKDIDDDQDGVSQDMSIPSINSSDKGRPSDVLINTKVLLQQQQRKEGDLLMNSATKLTKTEINTISIPDQDTIKDSDGEGKQSSQGSLDRDKSQPEFEGGEETSRERVESVSDSDEEKSNDKVQRAIKERKDLMKTLPKNPNAEEYKNFFDESNRLQAIIDSAFENKSVSPSPTKRRRNTSLSHSLSPARKNSLQPPTVIRRSGGRMYQLSGAKPSPSPFKSNQSSNRSSPPKKRGQAKGAKARLDTTSEENEGEEFDGEYMLSKHRSNDTFCNSFRAVVRKRVWLYQSNRKYLILDVFFPMIFMMAGVFATSFAHFGTSPSRILGPDRIGYENQLILIDKATTLRGDRGVVSEIIDNMKNGSYFDIRATNETYDFEGFNDHIYEYGRQERGEMPFFYAGYQLYDVDQDRNQYYFYNFLNMTNADAGSLYPQFMYEAILKHASRNKEFKFKVRNTPYPKNEQVKDRKNGNDASIISFVTGTAYSIALTTTIGQLVEERTSRLKHMQVISGVRLSGYWMANFFVDVIKMELTSLTSIIMFYFFIPTYREVMLTYLVFPFGSIPMTYVLSFAFPAVASAQTFTLFYYFLMVLCAPSISFFLRFFDTIFDFADKWWLFLKILPGCQFGSGLFYNACMHQLVDFRETYPEWPVDGRPWILMNIGGDLLGLAINFLFWGFLLILIETGCLRCRNCFIKAPKSTGNIRVDQDVDREAKRVQLMRDSELQIKVQKLRKVYFRGSGPCNPGAPLCAVENLSFGLAKGECFALLGVNGAGKSTTFKILTSEEELTSGTIKIQGMDMKKNFSKVRKLIGYCPQYNPIFETLTVAQNLEYFARIKGIPESQRDTLVQKAMEQLGLQGQKEKASGTLSGGNKRKLSVAIAIVGNPAIILLDEPSAGMDPEARRFMWDVVGKIASKKTSAVILTSHLMEEAEALSTKMGIMVKGGIFKCFGSSQHIKNKFGVGFEVEVKIKIPSLRKLIEMAAEELGNNFLPQSESTATYRNLQVKETMKALGLSQLEMAQIKRELVIHFKQARDTANIKALEDERVKGDVVCLAHIFMEKLLIARNSFGTIRAICRNFGSTDLLEQYGNYMRLRVSSKDRSIGQMFGMVDQLTKEFSIDHYSISQTTLEQIFQTFACLSFESQEKHFGLTKGGELELRAHGFSDTSTLEESSSKNTTGNIPKRMTLK